MKRLIKMHFEALCKPSIRWDRKFDNSRDVQVNWISFVFAQSQKAYIFLKRYGMVYLHVWDFIKSFPIVYLFVHLLTDKAENVPLVTLK